jgi:hypothetical protein
MYRHGDVCFFFPSPTLSSPRPASSQSSLRARTAPGPRQDHTATSLSPYGSSPRGWSVGWSHTALPLCSLLGIVALGRSEYAHRIFPEAAAPRALLDRAYGMALEQVGEPKVGMWPVITTDPLVRSDDERARRRMSRRTGSCRHSSKRVESSSSASCESSPLTPQTSHAIARAIAGAFAPIARGTC